MISRYGAIVPLAIVLSSSLTAGLTMRDDCCVQELDRICPCRIRIDESELDRNVLETSLVVKDAVYPTDKKEAIKVPEAETSEMLEVENAVENNATVQSSGTTPSSTPRTTQVMRKQVRRVFCCRRFGRLIYPRGCYFCRVG